mmetsp:Transcript_17850/g.26578  ORF Transcript_17850/g.26578 Transcript_17850/m.26578 type:complete len:84 (-) Transcript_17850:52-303(-)
MSVIQPTRVLFLYKSILRSAKYYPSIKREALIEDIRIEFRTAKNEKDTVTIRSLFEQAENGLEQLQKYEKMVKKEGGEWEISL